MAEREAERNRGEQSKRSNSRSDGRVICDKSLEAQIADLMRGLPEAERYKRWTMAEFVARLSGRYADRPHPMNVGRALRALGWRHFRDWSHQGGGRRNWSQ